MNSFEVEFVEGKNIKIRGCILVSEKGDFWK